MVMHSSNEKSYSMTEGLEMEAFQELKNMLAQSFVDVVKNYKENLTEIEKWKHIACHHELTDLPNRRMLNLTVESYVSKKGHETEKLAILFLDINKFKAINDQYGHIIGDQFLKEIARRLLSLSKLKNRVFHISGDEFVIMIKGIANLEEQIQSILNLFNSLFTIENHQFYASVSIGASIYPAHSTDIYTVIKYANAAMFAAKRSEPKMFVMHA